MNCLVTSAEFEPLISRNLIREKIRTALHIFAGRGRRFSVNELALGAGVDPKNIERAMRPVEAGDFRPLKLEELASIGKFLKAPFLSAILEPCGLGAFDLMEQPPLPQVLTSAPKSETKDEKRKRLIRELAALEDGE